MRRAVALVALILAFAPSALAQARIAVVTTTTDLRSLVEAVGGEAVAATSLVPPQIDAEDYQPRPQDLLGEGQPCRRPPAEASGLSHN